MLFLVHLVELIKGLFELQFIHLLHLLITYFLLANVPVRDLNCGQHAVLLTYDELVVLEHSDEPKNKNIKINTFF